jgi:hypothetical protein
MANSFDEEYVENMQLIIALSVWCIKNTRNPKHALHILEQVRKGMQESADLTPAQEAELEAEFKKIIRERKAQNVSKN